MKVEVDDQPLEIIRSVSTADKADKITKGRAGFWSTAFASGIGEFMRKTFLLPKPYVLNIMYVLRACGPIYSSHPCDPCRFGVRQYSARDPQSQTGGTQPRDVAFDYLSADLTTEEAVLHGE